MSSNKQTIFYRLTQHNLSEYGCNKFSSVEIDVYQCSEEETYFSDYEKLGTLKLSSHSLEETSTEQPTNYHPRRWQVYPTETLYNTRFSGYYGLKAELAGCNVISLADTAKALGGFLSKLEKTIEKFNLRYKYEGCQLAQIIDALDMIKAKQLVYNRNQYKLVKSVCDTFTAYAND